MSDEGSGWWDRIRGRLPFSARDAEATSNRELPVDRPTIGLCFDYARQFRFESEQLSDEGLDRVLSILLEHRLRATFNCAARLCELIPEQIIRIAEAGHEVAAYCYEHENIRSLSDDGIQGMLFRCRQAFAKCRLQPIGFRSRRSECDARLYDHLGLHRFVYNSEHDHAKHPYILKYGEPTIVRIPVCTDDSGFVRDNDRYNEVVSKHHRLLRKAVARGHFLSICYHPWILAESEQRMTDFTDWVRAAAESGARVGPMCDVLPARFRTIRPAAE